MMCIYEYIRKSGYYLQCVGVCDRAAIVSDAVVNYFLMDVNIEKHFVALHRYLLLQDGEFAQNLTDELFNKVWHFLSSMPVRFPRKFLEQLRSATRRFFLWFRDAGSAH